MSTLSEEIKACRAGIYSNPYQGNAKKALFVCTMSLLRSPTSAQVAAKEFGWNTRCAGVASEALQPVTEALLTWADHIYVMDEWHAKVINEITSDGFKDRITVLNIEDRYPYMDPELVEQIKTKLKENNDNRIRE